MIVTLATTSQNWTPPTHPPHSPSKIIINKNMVTQSLFKTQKKKLRNPGARYTRCCCCSFSPKSDLFIYFYFFLHLSRDGCHFTRHKQNTAILIVSFHPRVCFGESFLQSGDLFLVAKFRKKNK